MKTIWMVILGAIVAGVIGAQTLRINSLRTEMAELRTRMDGGPAPVNETQTRVADGRVVSLGSLPQRVSQLEETVGQLSKTADFLVERGVAPPSANHIEQMYGKFADASARDGDRLQALRVLRRNGKVTDEIAMQAMNWLETSTNARTKEDLLEELDGMTNAAMKVPLLNLLAKETSGNVREGLVQALSEFPPSPETDLKLWELALNDPDEDVREEAADAVTDGSMTPERLKALSDRFSNTQLSLDERLLALRGLRDGDKQPPEAIAELSALAKNSTDPLVRARLFEAFDGIRNPALMSPLVHGLQDPNPIARENAADALGTFASDPRILEWLNHVIQNDTDPRVKREAHEALSRAQRRRN